MGFFTNLFGKNNQTEISKNDNREDTKELVDLIGCDWEKVDSNLTNNEIMQLYVSEFEKGKNEGYTPILIVSDKVLIDSIVINYEDNGGAEQLRNSVINSDTSQGEKILKERFDDSINNYREFSSNSEELYGEYLNNDRPLMSFSSIDKDKDLILIKIPTNKPWEVFAWIPFGNWNDCPDTDDLIAICRYWFEKYGAVPALISKDILQMYVPDPITEESTALNVAEQHYAFCNDIVYQGVETIKALASLLIGATVWYFWWD